jgi:regulator of protease activity HflC (stomatin/prohibitin superfamily)
VEEGHVGIYYRGGALLDRITEPGYHFKIPFLDTFENVQVTVQTDKVTNIPCGTSGGVLIWFDRVEVVNRLRREYVYETIKNYTVHYDRMWIFDKIHHEINQFCSAHTLQEVYIDLFHTVDDRLVQALQADCNKWAPGVEIIAIRITKPKIPQTIARNYELMEAEKTKLMIATQAQKVVEKEAETDRKKAKIEAEKVAEVSKIRMEQQIAEKEAQRKMAQIEDETHLAHVKSLADAEYYRVTRQAEANQKQLTAEYLYLELIRSVSNNTKIYFGPSVHNMFADFLQHMQQTLTSRGGESSSNGGSSQSSSKPTD